MMKKPCLLLILPLVLVLLSSLVLADGGFFPPTYYHEDIYEPTQKGIIIFDGNIEQLIIQVTYEGEMSDFAWVIPVPSYPDINKTSSYLFEELHFLTEPNYKSSPMSSFGGMMYASKMLEGTGVTVHEQKQVGIYEVTILSSDDPKALVNWLNNNDYSVSAEAEPVLDFYVQKKWYFIAMRINLVPYDETLINSLKNINPAITSSEDAVTILTNGLVQAIKSETKYNELTDVRTTKIDYGEDSEELTGDYRYERYERDKPSLLITETEYNRDYEQYNGYFEYHITRDIQNKISNKLGQELRIPGSRDCYDNRLGIDQSRCYVWYFTQESEEYQVLKDVECGKYCSLVSEEKSQYEIDDLAKVGAYAVIKDDESVKNYFGVTRVKLHWYDNEQDQFDNVESQIKSRLWGALNDQETALVNQLANELTAEYSQKTGSTLGSVNGISTFFSEKTLDDFKENKDFSQSYVYQISGFDLLTSSREYNQLKSLFDGDHDEIKLKNNVETKVKNVVYWKQTTVQRKLGSGTVQPISIEFETTNIIYPLKISSINKGASEILLYVFAKHRTKVEGIEGFEVEYAKWIETDDIKTERYYSYLDRIREEESKMIPSYWSRDTYYYLNQILDDRYFLTKFRKKMWPKEMTDDLLITQAENNKEYRLTIYEGGYVGYILGWFGFFIILAILWGILLSIYLLPKWVNNKIIHNNKESVFYISIKRCAVYALIIPLTVLFSFISPNTVEKLIGDIARSFWEILEFISHLLNFIGLPSALNGIIVLILTIVIIFSITHLIGSIIILAYKKIKRARLHSQY